MQFLIHIFKPNSSEDVGHFLMSIQSKIKRVETTATTLVSACYHLIQASGSTNDFKVLTIQGAYKLSEDFAKPYFHKYQP